MTDRFAISTSPEMATNLELNISCSDLIALDLLSKSDPIVAVFIERNGTWEELGRTEWVKNVSNVQFTKTIPVKYYFEERQSLRFSVFDVDNESKVDLTTGKGADPIGEVRCCLGDIVSSSGGSKTEELKNEKHPNRKNGKITIKAMEVGNSNVTVKFKLSGRKLDKKDFLGKSDPYVVIHRGNPDGRTFSQVHKTEIIKNTLDPVWKHFEISLGKLCGGNVELPLFVECYDWDSSGKDDLIGQFTTTFTEIRSKVEFELIEPKIQAKKGKKYTNSGILVMACEETVLPTFIDFVTGGTEISLVVGIDFTGSNGKPSEPKSLHYLNPMAPNEYQQALRSVGDVVTPYDHDGIIPAYGFGARLLNFNPPTVSHCFPLTGNPQQPNCYGVDGILAAYSQSFSWLELYGPTNFAPIIDNVASMASQHKGGDKYFILLMLTDGVITDMPQTKQAIQRATKLPMSIIIVGVGNADFTNMNQLDDDEGQMGFQRDIVQFVPFRNYRGSSPQLLAKETLKEVPMQLLDYMKQNNIKPRRV